MQRRSLLILLLLVLSACNFGGQPATEIPASAPPATGAAARATSGAATGVTPTAPPKASPTSAPTVRNTPTKVPATPTQEGTVAQPLTNAPAPTSSGNTASGSEGPHVLAWNKDTKQIAWYAATGQPQKIAEGQATRVLSCGLTPTGDRMILYKGDALAQPNLIALASGDAPISLGDSSALACELGGRTAFSPDGNWLGLIKYTADAASGADFTSGTLRLLKAPDFAEQTTFDKTTAFDLENDGVVILKFFGNAKGQADRADLTWWDAASSKERSLEADIKSSDNCVFTSGRVLRVAEKVYTAIGERCTKPTVSSIYRILRTDFAGGNSTNFVSNTATGGKYYPNTNTNDLMLLPDGKTLLLLFPNGQSTDVANLVRINTDDGKVVNVAAAVITDQSPAAMPRRLLRNPNGTQLAFVTRNGNGGETLYLYDLTKPDSDPAQITDLNRSNRINAIAWNKAGDRLVYLVSGDDPSLSYIDLSGTKKLVARGIFQGLAISPDGNIASTSEQVQVDKNDLRNNLLEVTLNDGNRTKLVEGQRGDSALVPLAVR